MARLPLDNGEIRGFVHEEIEEALDWLNADGDNFRRVDGTVVAYTNEDGDEFFFKQEEVEVVIERVINKVIKEKSIDIHKDVEKGFKDYTSKNIKALEDRTMNHFYNKIDEVAEKLAEKMLNYKIEAEVQKRVEKKLKQMEKILKE